MTTRVHNATSEFSLPSINRATVATGVIAGAFATIAFDAYGQGFSPLFGFAKLAPVGLAQSTLQSVFGFSSTPAAHLLHVLTGLVFYVIGWMFIFEPLAKRFVPAMPWWVSAIAYGVALWVFAIYIMAHLVAGLPAFLGFTGITWAALWGHVIYAVVLAWVIRLRQAA